MGSVTQADIRQSLIGRIQSGEWSLGSRIPAETALAKEYGCARATMNRALQGLAEDGLVLRRRKGGTHVSLHPVKSARIAIPIIREQVESAGQTYSHTLVTRERKRAPAIIRSQLQLQAGAEAVFLETLHLANGRPFAFERRWVNTDAVPEIADAPLDTINANEWLVRTVPFSDGQVDFSAISLSGDVADMLGTDTGAASFTIQRTTWIGDRRITTMTLHYRPGYTLHSAL